MPNAYDPFTLQVQNAAWDTVPNRTVYEDQVFILNLNAFLPDAEQWTITRKADSDAFPNQLVLGTDGRITGTQSQPFSRRNITFVASIGNITIESRRVGFIFQSTTRPAFAYPGFRDVSNYQSRGSYARFRIYYDETATFSTHGTAPVDSITSRVEYEQTLVNPRTGDSETFTVADIRVTTDVSLPAASGTVRLRFSMYLPFIPDLPGSTVLGRVGVTLSNGYGNVTSSGRLYLVIT